MNKRTMEQKINKLEEMLKENIDIKNWRDESTKIMSQMNYDEFRKWEARCLRFFNIAQVYRKKLAISKEKFAIKLTEDKNDIECPIEQIEVAFREGVPWFKFQSFMDVCVMLAPKTEMYQYLYPLSFIEKNKHKYNHYHLSGNKLGDKYISLQVVVDICNSLPGEEYQLFKKWALSIAPFRVLVTIKDTYEESLDIFSPLNSNTKPIYYPDENKYLDVYFIKINNNDKIAACVYNGDIYFNLKDINQSVDATKTNKSRNSIYGIVNYHKKIKRHTKRFSLFNKFCLFINTYGIKLVSNHTTISVVRELNNIAYSKNIDTSSFDNFVKSIQSLGY